MTEPQEDGADRTEERGSPAASEPKGAPPSVKGQGRRVGSEGARNERPSEEGRRRSVGGMGRRAGSRRRAEGTA